MEIPLWFIFAIVALIFRGLGSFCLKVISHKDLDSNFIFLVQMFLATFLLSFFIDYKNLDVLIDSYILLYTGAVGLLLFFHKKISILVLKDVSSSMVFISSRIFPTLLLLVFSMFIFQEFLSSKEIIGILVGILTFVFLYDNKDIAKESSDFKRGIVNLGLLVFTGAFLIVMIKLAVQIDVILSLFLYSVFCFLFFLIEAIFKNSIAFKKINNSTNSFYGLLLAICFCVANYFLFKALQIANTAVVYKIFSYEIFIPIVLSILFFDEKVTFRKIIAFILTVLSLFFFL